MILIKLFLSFARIGLFAIGGAYSFLPLIEKEVVVNYNWLTKEEFMDILGISRVFPGAISIKYATYTGYKMAGLPGAVAANLGNIIIPASLMISASVLYSKYKHLPSIKGAFSMIHLAIFAMIIAVAFQIIETNQLMQVKNVAIIVIAFILFLYSKIHPALIIIVAGLLGAFFK